MKRKEKGKLIYEMNEYLERRPPDAGRKEYSCRYKESVLTYVRHCRFPDPETGFFFVRNSRKFKIRFRLNSHKLDEIVD